jgi:hypothetical protein
MRIFSVFICLLIVPAASFGQSLLRLKSGEIEFVSEAPLELISASTSRFQAVIDTTKGNFAISIPIKGFEGFNSSLQQEHFYENYMEIDRFANAQFSGKILEPISYSETSFNITLKGELEVHGIKKTRVVSASCRWLDQDTLLIESKFEILLAEHNIDIPRVVYQKIAEVISVTVTAELSSGI